MLILTRRLNERIIIGQNIEVQILNIRGNQVRIGIKAPKTTPIHPYNRPAQKAPMALFGCYEFPILN